MLAKAHNTHEVKNALKVLRWMPYPTRIKAFQALKNEEPLLYTWLFQMPDAIPPAMEFIKKHIKPKDAQEILLAETSQWGPFLMNAAGYAPREIFQSIMETARVVFGEQELLRVLKEEGGFQGNAFHRAARGRYVENLHTLLRIVESISMDEAVDAWRIKNVGNMLFYQYLHPIELIPVVKEFQSAIRFFTEPYEGDFPFWKLATQVKDDVLPILIEKGGSVVREGDEEKWQLYLGDGLSDPNIFKKRKEMLEKVHPKAGQIIRDTLLNPPTNITLSIDVAGQIFLVMKQYLSLEERKVLYFDKGLMDYAGPYTEVFDEVLKMLKGMGEEELNEVLAPRRTLIEGAIQYKGPYALFRLIEERLHPTEKDLKKWLEQGIWVGLQSARAVWDFVRNNVPQETLTEWARELLGSTLSSDVVLLEYLEEADSERKSLYRVLTFIAEDRRSEVETFYLQLLRRIRWEEKDWRKAIFSWMSDSLYRVFAHKEVLGKPGKWSRKKLRLLAEVFFYGGMLPSALEEKLNKVSPPDAYKVIETYFMLPEDNIWKDTVIEEAGNPDFFLRVGKRYLEKTVLKDSPEVGQKIIENLQRYYPNIVGPVLLWAGSTLTKYPQYVPLFIKIFSASPEEYKKIRYEEWELPWKEIWMEEINEEIEVKWSVDKERLKSLIRKIENYWNIRFPADFENLSVKDQYKVLQQLEKENRDNKPFLRALKQVKEVIDPGEKPSRLIFRFTDDLEAMFMMGKGPQIHSCLAYDGNMEQNIALLGQSLHPAIKVAMLVDEREQIITRVKVYIIDEGNGRYKVELDTPYGYKEVKDVMIKRIEKKLQKWKEMGIINGFELESNNPNRKLAGKRPEAPIHSDSGLYGERGLIKPSFLNT